MTQINRGNLFYSPEANVERVVSGIVGLKDTGDTQIDPAVKYTSGNPYVKKLTSTGVHDINTNLGRNVHHGWIKADSTNAVVASIKLSSDGSTYTDAIEDIQKGDAFDIEKMDLHSIDVIAVGGTAIHLVVW